MLLFFCVAPQNKTKKPPIDFSIFHREKLNKNKTRNKNHFPFFFLLFRKLCWNNNKSQALWEIY